MKYVSYIRVSTKKQGDSGLGLESQRAIIAHYFPDIEKEYLEIGSGKNVTDRPILSEAMRYCEDNKTTLVIAKVDRLSRDVVDGLTIVKKMEGRITFCDLPGEVDRFTLTLYFAFAEREREIISIRTKNGLNSKRVRNEPMGTNLPQCKNNLSPLIYKQMGAAATKLKALENEENRKAFNYADSLQDRGLTYKQIVEKLNMANKTANGGKWHTGSVYRLLKRHRGI